ncbi:MAG TPA: [Fe-Fe] hydrogenase large subunit C-terminal domain-containing protein [Candidatus Dojkabacteria bacterium]|nr:[Fe-Fe] hydrogenase large subunit C-terminal domain-containing protein [Candidatus Dojkabacteria bacterium]
MEFKKGQKYICLLAPSFITEYEYPNIIYRLRKLGFDKVMEVTFGAKMTNITYYSLLKESLEKGEKKTWIASPCPTIVNFIRVKYPHLVENLVSAHSPMGCMGLYVKKKYPKRKVVFIGPCMTKKLEAGETGVVDDVLTFKELEELFKKYNIEEEVKENKYCIGFDKLYNDYTKIYPVSGGLSDTLHGGLLKDKDILIMEGLNNLMPVFDAFKDGVYKHYKFLDILNCDGGCINGPGMISEKNIKERRKKVFKYRDYARRYEKDLGRTGLKAHAKGINFKREF